MTPVESTVVAVAAPPQSREASLAQQAASKLAASLPHKPASEIVEDLIARLQRKRSSRDAAGLNHWESYGPAYLEKLVKRFQIADPLRQIVGFIVVNHDSAVEFAARVTCDADLAETAVSRTYIELLNGDTTVTLFYRALKMNARDLLKARAREFKRFESLDALVSAARADHALAVDSDTSNACEDIDFPSRRLEDQDPLDILIARQDERQEQRELADEMAYALRVVRCEGNRWILKKDWWKESAIGRAEKKRRRTELRGSVE